MKIVRTFLLCGILIGMTACSTEHPAPQTRIPVQIGAQVFNAEIADEPHERATGLMFRTQMNEDSGMLFLFDEEATHGFYMKNTRIPLDIIWIDAEKRVVHIAQMQPCTTEPCPVVRPTVSSKYVLEVNAGAFSGKIGDEAVFTIPSS